MLYATEKSLAARVKALGESADPAALFELAGMYLKQDLYMHAGKKLISLYPDDKARLDTALGAKLATLGRMPPTAASSADSLLSADNPTERHP